jgi:AAA15 family ATPase/GTPase
MLKRLVLKNFTAFDNLALDLSPRINVIIGENASGKTHLLKAAYILCSGASLSQNKSDLNRDELEAALTTKLLGVFLPLDDKLGRLHRLGATDPACLFAQFSPDQKISLTFGNDSKALVIQDRTNYGENMDDAVLIPTKESLSFMLGFNSLYDKHRISFDQTYRDLGMLLDLPPLRQENLHEKAKWAMAEIEKVCGGRFIFSGGGKVTFQAAQSEYSANIIAEGFRKLGILARLLETGSIQPGVSGPLFWDNPESNLNPKLMELMVRILLELARSGQQIILATHDYVLLKWFDLFRHKDDQVVFHSLYNDRKTLASQATSTGDYRTIIPNPIDEAFGSLVNQEITNEMGTLGK